MGVYSVDLKAVVYIKRFKNPNSRLVNPFQSDENCRIMYLYVPMY